MKSIRYITVTAMGIALFVALTLCMQVPIFENYYACLGYIVMAVYCCSVGITSGTLVGVIGVILYCLIIGGLRGMPGWALGNAVIGLISGATFKYTRRLNNKAVRCMLCGIAILFSTFLGILVCKSILESFMYSQPFFVRVVNNIYAFVADAVVLMLSIPFCEILDDKVRRYINDLNGGVKNV